MVPFPEVRTRDSEERTKKKTEARAGRARRQAVRRTPPSDPRARRPDSSVQAREKLPACNQRRRVPSTIVHAWIATAIIDRPWQIDSWDGTSSSGGQDSGHGGNNERRNLTVLLLPLRPGHRRTLPTGNRWPGSHRIVPTAREGRKKHQAIDASIQGRPLQFSLPLYSGVLCIFSCHRQDWT